MTRSASAAADRHEAAYLEELTALWQLRWPTGVAAAPAYPLGEIPLTGYLRRWARDRGDRPAIIYYGTEVSYAELDESSDRLAGFLQASGLQGGDRVAVALPNCPQLFIAFYAILKSGCVYVPVNPGYKPQELLHILTDSGARTLVTFSAARQLIDAVSDGSAVGRMIIADLGDYLPATPELPLPAMLSRLGRLGEQSAFQCGGSAIPWADALRAQRVSGGTQPGELDRLAALNYTGGTTGLPKGCRHSQRNMIYAGACARSVGVISGADAVSLVFVPLCWIAGEDYGLIAPIFTGTTCVVLARWDADAALAAISRYGVTTMLGTVDHYVEMLHRCPAAGERLGTLRAPLAMSFVTRLNEQIRDQWSERAGGLSIVREAGYGMTETHALDTFTTGLQGGDADIRSEPVFCGLPVPGTQLKIVDFGSGALVPLGSAGGLAIRSPSVCDGYWGNPAESAAVLQDGWLHTGDIAMLDTSGYLHFLGRRKEMLKVAGASVFPAEVESLVCRHPAVAGCGVVGMADPRKGEIPVAFVELRESWVASLTEVEFTAWCKENMASYKVPLVRFVDRLPLTPTGKVWKEALRRLLYR